MRHDIITFETHDKTFSKIEKKTEWYSSQRCKNSKMNEKIMFEFNCIITKNILQIFPHKEHYQQLILLCYLQIFQEKKAFF